MEIRQFRREELEENLRLSEFAFQYDMTVEERVERLASLDPEQQWGFFQEGTLAAKMTLLPLRVFVQGRKMAMGGIAGVATWPEHRRQGKVARLLANALEVMRTNGQTLSFLHPFEFAFYRKYGWETYSEFKKYELMVSQLPQFPRPAGAMVRTRDLQLLNGVYEAYAARYNGMLVRETDWWERRILEGRSRKGDFAAYLDPAGEPKGYIQYKVRDGVMRIEELVHLDESARRALWSFVRDHDSMLQKVELNRTPADDNLTFLLDDPRIKQEVVPYFMARVVDAEALLAQYPFEATGRQYRFVLRLEDAQAPWNNGFLEVDVDGGGHAAVRRVEEAAGYAQATCRIQTLAALLLGYRRPGELHALGRLHAENDMLEVLEELIPQRLPYLADFF